MSIKQKWNDLVAREKEKTKNMTFKQKVEYVAENWWFEIIGTLVLLGVAVGCGILIYNSCKEHILYFGVVDVSMSEKECRQIEKDFKEYIENDDPMEVIYMESQISSLGVAESTDDLIPEITDEQQKSTILIGTGLIDAYICPEVYVDYLLEWEDLDTVANVMDAETVSQYSERITKDGYAFDLTGTAAAELFHVKYEPCYLVFTYNSANHSPEVTQAFARYLLEK